MLAEGFLRLLCYREKRKFYTASSQKKWPTDSQCSQQFNPGSSSSDLQVKSSEAVPNQVVPDPNQPQELQVTPQAPGLLIPRCLPVTIMQPVCIEDCSLLQQYPDLQVADPGRIPHNPPRASVSQHDLHGPHTLPGESFQPQVQQEPQREQVLSVPDQGYLVMGASVNISLDLPGSGLEPMSNSVLNGLLEKQLEEVYMQHLTDNLARCNSHLGNSLLHGLVPPPQPGQSQGPYSLEVSQGEGSRRDSSSEISYMHTQNLIPCSSTFSSPVLRISEPDNPHLQGNIPPKY
ncbi:uncharacterized protein si:dkey-237j10.2 [Cololabis saira]|uniref:uncharacterized protein si:dkey-237j10.2 n=1 Tax=Cololabis saira TaxID=129043 RepID=UPI002AD459D9|nr:uncharacterized protein si:dkey-237j10.2 [Cololabis saira]